MESAPVSTRAGTRLARALRDRGYEVQTAAGFDEAIAHCARESPEYAVVDLRMLSDCGGNVSEAARRLGIHRRSLQRKLQKYPPAG